MTQYPDGVTIGFDENRSLAQAAPDAGADHMWTPDAPTRVDWPDDITTSLERAPYPMENIEDGDWLYYWTHWSAWGDRDGDPLPADDLTNRLGDTVAAVSGPGSATGRVEFDIFSSQTGGVWTSYCDVASGGYVERSMIRLPLVSASLDRFVQLRNFTGDVPMHTKGCVVTIFNDVPYLMQAREGENGELAPSGCFAGVVEDIATAYVGDSTGDTLDQYPTSIQT